MNNHVLFANIEYVKQGIELLNELENHVYARNQHVYFSSGVGKHMRHIIDHYLSFLNGIADEKVNYDARDRQIVLETDCDMAAYRMSEVAKRLAELNETPVVFKKTLIVISNAVGSDPMAGASRSSVQRELQFLLSHTVHHYALVAMILRVQGIDTDNGFGVAPSTLKYQQTIG